MGQGFFESDEEYAKRMAKEAAEKTIRDNTGRNPSQGFLESDDEYHSRIVREAGEKEIERISGDRPSQGFFESDDDYAKRVDIESSEQRYMGLTGRRASQGFFEGNDEYRARVHREATEADIKEQSGRDPSQGFFEGNAEYHRRITLERNERRTKQDRAANETDEAAASDRGSAHSSGGSGGTRSGSSGTFDWRDIDFVILAVACASCGQPEGHYFKRPDIRGCKLCGYQADLDRSWPQAIQEMIDSGLYMRVGNGRSLIMTNDWAAATQLGLRPRLLKLWDLRQYDDGPATTDDDSVRWGRRLLKIAMVVLLLAWLVKLIAGSSFGSRPDQPATDTAPSPAFVAEPAVSDPAPPTVRVLTLGFAEGYDPQAGISSPTATFVGNGRYDRSRRDGLYAFATFEGAVPGRTAFRIEFWQDGKNLAGFQSCAPVGRESMSRDWIADSAAGEFVCGSLGYYFYPGQYEGRLFIDNTFVKAATFQVVSPVDAAPETPDAPATASEDQSAASDAAADAPPTADRVSCVLTDGQVTTLQRADCRSRGGVIE